jgi:hypothetical protein
MTAGRSAPDRSLAALLDVAARLPAAASLWAGTLDLIHFDAPVRVLRAEPLDPLHRLLLRAVGATAPAALDQLDARLGLGRPVLHRWLGELTGAGLIRSNDHYALTAAGTAALAGGTAARSVGERRRFTFVVNPDGTHHFLPWTAPPGPACPAPAADVGWLTECFNRPVAWKRRTGFSDDVIAVDRPAAAVGAAAWKRLTVVRGERPAVALALTADSSAHLVAFAAGSAEPALRIDGGWEDAFPELTASPAAVRTEIDGGWVLMGDGRLRRASRRQPDVV